MQAVDILNELSTLHKLSAHVRAGVVVDIRSKVCHEEPQHLLLLLLLLRLLLLLLLLLPLLLLLLQVLAVVVHVLEHCAAGVVAFAGIIT